MSLEVTVHDASGRIVQTMKVQTLDQIAPVIPVGGGAIFGIWPDDRYYVADSEAVEIPARPNDWARFDFASGTWLDERTPADYEAQLQAARAAAWMGRPDFVLIAVQHGFIAESEALLAARGDVPPSLVDVFAHLPASMQLEASVRWAASTQIERLHPVLLAIADAKSIPAEALDDAFGIAVPPLPEVEP